MRWIRINEIKELQQEVGQIKERLAVAESTIQRVEQKIEKIENNTSWTIRLILGVIIISTLKLMLNPYLIDFFK